MRGSAVILIHGQHKHYCGTDLHAKAMGVGILDQHGTTLVHKNLSTPPQLYCDPCPVSGRSARRRQMNVCVVSASGLLREGMHCVCAAVYRQVPRRQELQTFPYHVASTELPALSRSLGWGRCPLVVDLEPQYRLHCGRRRQVNTRFIRQPNMAFYQRLFTVFFSGQPVGDFPASSQ
jgi:hypothetical protein